VKVARTVLREPGAGNSPWATRRFFKEENMEIKQKKFSNKTNFSFGRSQLKYNIEDNSASTTFSIDYSDIPFEFDEFEEKNQWFRNAGLLWILIGAIQGGLNILEHGRIGGFFWLFIGLICMAIFYYAKTKYSIFNTEKGRIFVIQNKQYEKIMSTIINRRKTHLKELYGEINLGRNPNDEISKFQWLVDHSVISQVEFSEIKQKIIALTTAEQHIENSAKIFN
jgi:hypothetical protein